VKTKYDLAIWHNSEEGETYAFPIGTTDSWSGTVYPALNNAAWTYKGTMPKGCPVADVKPVAGRRVRCKLNGSAVSTADWVLED
jgi:hypothetical protein